MTQRLKKTRVVCLYLGFALGLHCGFLSNGRANGQDIGVRQPSNANLLEAARMLPDTVIALAEVENLGESVAMLLDHPLREKLERLPVYEQFLKSDQFTQLRGGTLVFEAGMGRRWPQVLNSLSAKGIFVAFDPNEESVALLIHADDGEVLDQIRKTVFPLIRGAEAGTASDPIEKKENEAYTGYSIRNESYLVDLDAWYVLSNQAEFANKIAKLHLSKTPRNTLADSASFNQALRFRPDSFLLWSYVDAQTVRDSGEATELYSGKTENILAEMLFGGIMSTLRHTDLISASVQLEADKLQLSVKTPHDKSWAGEDRQYFFGNQGNAKARAIPETKGQIFGLTAYRGLSEMWLRAPDLMTEKAVEETAQADSQLAIFFSGKDFGEDILGAFGPEIQLLVQRQDFESISPTPALKLPSFGLRFEMVEPKKNIKEFRRVFQSLLGFLNVVGAMEGNPPLDMDWEREEGYEMISGTFASNLSEAEAKAAPIQFNFSPAVIFAGNTFAIASTKELAKSMAELQTDGSSQANTAAKLDAGLLDEVLRDNMEQLVAQNMLEKGHSREDAQAEIGLLLDLLEFVKDLESQLLVSEDELELKTLLRLNIPDTE